MGWKGGVVSSGADTYLSRRSTPDWGLRTSIPTHQAAIAAGAGSAKLRMLRRGLGRSPSIRKFCDFRDFLLQKKRKKFPQKIRAPPQNCP